LRESEQKFRSLFNQASDAIFLLLPVDDDLIIQDANYAALEMHGYAKDELAGKSISLLDDPETRRHIAERVKRLMPGEPLHAQGVHVRKDGSSFPVDISAQRIYIGYKPYVLAIDRDITDRKKAEQALIESEAKFRDLVESTSDWVWETDENGRYTYSSPKVKDVLGYDVPEVIGKTPFDFMPEDEAHKIITAFDGIKAEPRPFHGLENINRHKRGHLVVLESSGVPVFDKDGQLRGFRGIDRDITQLKKIEQKLHEMSITDELTGLLNRRGFFALADQQCKLADRTKRQMCLIYIDLDGLKIINDELGHETGDRALIETAEVLKKTFRESDIMARIGGDEFVVLLTEPAETGVENVTARLIEENLRVHNTQAGRKFELMFSMGSAIYDPERPCSVNDLISRADESMYADKQRRRLER
ncbi:MAG: sensor domain-containing diguanylate cyclase, partial [Nitrospirae bacterium]|nr:sensor domain-containing diguanylate cyclase [Nitrospirota bacterium]